MRKSPIGHPSWIWKHSRKLRLRKQAVAIHLIPIPVSRNVLSHSSYNSLMYFVPFLLRRPLRFEQNPVMSGITYVSAVVVLSEPR